MMMREMSKVRNIRGHIVHVEQQQQQPLLWDTLEMVNYT